MRRARVIAGLVWGTALGFQLAGPMMLSGAQTGGSAGVAQATSHSGRFMVTMTAPARLAPREQAANAALGIAELSPTLVAVSCERVKDALYRTLGVAGGQGRRIHVTVAPASGSLSVPRVTSTMFRDGWQHQVTLPSPLDESAFVSAIVQVLLIQMVDRAPAQTPAEIPLWLATGLAPQVRVWNPHLLVRGDLRELHSERRAPDPLEHARIALASRPALSFDELSWPTSADLGGDRGESYRHSAHLFTERLLSLRNGPALCRQFIASLSGHLNWQTAFLRVYAAEFPNLLAIEKWWAVHLVAFAGRDQWQTWPLLTALTRLDEAVRVDARVRAADDNVPTNATVSLQTLLAEWSGAQRREGVQAARQKLVRVRIGSPPTMVPLVDGYLGVLQEMSQPATAPAPGPAMDLHRNPFTGWTVLTGLPAGARPLVNLPAPAAEPSIRPLVRRLDGLDAQRLALRDMALRAARTSLAR